MRFYLVAVALLVGSVTGQARGQRDSLRLRAEHLGRLTALAPTITPGEAWNDSLDINQAIGQALLTVLRTPRVRDKDLDSLMDSTFFNVARSTDGRLRVYSWFENTGGSFLSYLHVLFYRDAKGRGRAFFPEAAENTFQNNFAYGSSVYAIHALRSNELAGRLYVCVGSVRGCNTCCAEVLHVVQLTDTALVLDPPV
ncbi:MAG TPA: hypothetical protein VHL57_08870, partial [Flavobacteriales bacterium]|nr:hypothetical protein [Flavobacteriales bacterium]